MNAEKEIKRLENRIAGDKKQIEELKEEIIALKQLLDCAAANLVLLVREGGGTKKISRKEVGEVLGRYHLGAKCDDSGNYILEIVEEK